MTSQNNSLFAAAALEEMGSAATSDSLTRVIDAWVWFLLAALSMAVGAVVYWGFFGVMIDSVSGVGVTVRSGGVDAIVARGPGIIENLTIAPGDRVSRYSVIGQVHNAQNFFTLSRLEMEYRQLRDYLGQVEAGTENVTGLARQSARQKEEELRKLLEKTEDHRRRSLEISGMYKHALDKNSVSAVDYYRALEQTLQLESSLSAIVQQYMQSELQRGFTEWENQRVRLSGLKDKQLKERELELARSLFRDSAWLRPDNDGVVVEVLKDVGDPVVTGEKVAIVSTSKFPDLKVVAFVPMEEGKKVRPGMSVFFSPSSFNARQYGYIQGVVLETSQFAVSTASIEAELKNPDLALGIGRKGVQMRVVVELLPDKNAPSRYKWTSRNGAPAPIEAGSFGTLLINAEQRAPVSYVIPYVRQAVLGIGKERRAPKEARETDPRGNR